MNTCREKEEARYGVIIANEILHHRCELEWFFESTRFTLKFCVRKPTPC